MVALVFLSGSTLRPTSALSRVAALRAQFIEGTDCFPALWSCMQSGDRRDRVIARNRKKHPVSRCGKCLTDSKWRIEQSMERMQVRETSSAEGIQRPCDSPAPADMRLRCISCWETGSPGLL